MRARAQQEQQERHAKQQAEKAAAASRAADAAAATAAANAADDVSDDDTTQLLLRTVKVSWDPSVGTSYISNGLTSTVELLEHVLGCCMQADIRAIRTSHMSGKSYVLPAANMSVASHAHE